MKYNSLIILLIALMHSHSCFAKKVGNIAIVLDDMGNSLSDFQAISLPKEVTFSILPYTPQGKRLAKIARQQNREILAHIPMQAKTGNRMLGKGALMLNMHEQEFKAQLQRALHYLPDAQGINNHMGSRLTEKTKPMRWTMEVLQQRGFYFLDSRTTAQTIAESTAKILNVPALRRNVFLDNVKTEQAMRRQLQRAVHLSKYQQKVVIIAHPYPETLHFLEQQLKQPISGFKLIALKQLIPKTQRLAMSQKQNEFQQAKNTTITTHSIQTQ